MEADLLKIFSMLTEKNKTNVAIKSALKKSIVAIAKDKGLFLYNLAKKKRSKKQLHSRRFYYIVKVARLFRLIFLTLLFIELFHRPIRLN